MSLLLTAAWVLSSPVESLCQEPGADNVFEMGEVVVTEKRSTAGEVATVTEITRKEFDSWSAYTVGDALKQIPGGSVTLSPGSLGGNGKQESLLRLRGFQTTDLLILLDGMPMTEPYMKRVDLNQIPLDNVAKITVTKGPSSVLYGSNTMGGIVEIVTQQGDEFRTSLDQRFRDYKSFQTIAHHRGMLGNFRYVLGGSYDRSDGFVISQDFEGARNQQGDLRENSDYERYDFTGRVGLDIGSQGSVAVSGGYYSFGGGVPYDMAAVDPATLWRKDWDRWYVNGSGEWVFTDALGIKAQGYYNNFDNKIKTYTDTALEEIASDGRGVSTYDNSIIGYFINPYWNLGAASHLKGGIRYNLDEVSIQDSKGEPWKDYRAETFAFALEDEVRPITSLSFVGGLGYNLYRKLEAFEQSPGDDVDAVDFQAGLVCTALPYVMARAGVGRKTTFPTMRELYSFLGGNPDLSEQSALTVEVGFESNLPKEAPGGSVAFFRSEVDDLIGRKELGNTFIFENIDEALIQGIELSLFWDPIEPLGLQFDYTYLDTEDKRPDRVMRELDFLSRHQFGVLVYYQSSFGLNANTRYRYFSAQKYEQTAVVPPTVGELPDRGVWDIHVGQKFPFERSPKRHLEIYLDVQNLLNEYFEEDPGKAASGRTVWAGIRAVF